MMSFSEIWKAWQRDPGTVSCLQKIWVKKNKANFSGFSFGEVSLRSFLTFPFSFECLQVILFLPYELLVGSCILAVSGLVESSMRRRMATLLNSESMLTSFRQKLGWCSWCCFWGLIWTVWMIRWNYSDNSLERVHKEAGCNFEQPIVAVGLSTASGFLCCLGCFGAFVMVKSCWTASFASLEKGAWRHLAFAFEVYVGVCVSCCLLHLIILTTDKLENHSKHRKHPWFWSQNKICAQSLILGI